jgi:hypothetical protein
MRSGFVVYAATACLLANLASGQASIYLAQRIHVDDNVPPTDRRRTTG